MYLGWGLNLGSTVLPHLRDADVTRLDACPFCGEFPPLLGVEMGERVCMCRKPGSIVFCVCVWDGNKHP